MFQAQAQHERAIPGAVATLGVDARRDFLKKTYGHLLGAILAFTALEFALLSESSPLREAVAEPILRMLFSGGNAGWMIAIVLFMAVGWIAERWAHSDTSRGIQYLGLGVYVVMQALLTLPILAIASTYYAEAIPMAGLSTLLLFTGLTATVFLTKKDFSFLGGALAIGGLSLLAIIFGAMIFGFQLGLVFSVFVLALAAGYVLYYTSQVMAHMRPTQYVAGGLLLFAAIALMFRAILQIFMSVRD